jgi:acyl-CoA thioesterase
MDLEGVGDPDDPGVRMFADDRASAGAGIRPVEIRLGYARVEMTITEQHLNGHGTGHGGLVFLLADAAFAAACNSGRTTTVAATAEIDFVAAARLGDELVAVAEERHSWGRSGICDVTVTRADGELIAVFRGRSRTLRS